MTTMVTPLSSTARTTWLANSPGDSSVGSICAIISCPASRSAATDMSSVSLRSWKVPSLSSKR
jgi:hypothetical protein